MQHLEIEMGDRRMRISSWETWPCPPLAMGPLAMGPLAMGPLARPPLAMGPLAMGPLPCCSRSQGLGATREPTPFLFCFLAFFIGRSLSWRESL
jgi:hypothetical protein